MKKFLFLIILIVPIIAETDIDDEIDVLTSFKDDLPEQCKIAAHIAYDKCLPYKSQKFFYKRLNTLNNYKSQKVEHPHVHAVRMCVLNSLDLRFCHQYFDTFEKFKKNLVCYPHKKNGCY